MIRISYSECKCNMYLILNCWGERHGMLRVIKTCQDGAGRGVCGVERDLYKSTDKLGAQGHEIWKVGKPRECT